MNGNQRVRPRPNASEQLFCHCEPSETELHRYRTLPEFFESAKS